MSRLLQARVVRIVGHGKSIMSCLLQAGGAHKPNGWDFGDGLGLKFTDEW